MIAQPGPGAIRAFCNAGILYVVPDRRYMFCVRLCRLKMWPVGEWSGILGLQAEYLYSTGGTSSDVVFRGQHGTIV